MANRRYTSQFLYQFEAMPVLLSCNFVVDSTNALGITSLKGGGIKNVFMHTSTTPSGGNPNPEAGVIMVQLQDNYSKLLSQTSGVIAALDGSGQTSTTAGRASVITVLGTATLAQWQTRGLPVGVTPAVGVCFIATTTGAIGGSAQVQRPLASNIAAIEACGSPAQSMALTQSAVNGGSIIILQTLAPSAAAATFTGAALATHDHSIPPGTDGAGGTTGATSAGTPAGTISAAAMSMVRTAPTNGSIISLDLYLSNSSVTQQGQ